LKTIFIELGEATERGDVFKVREVLRTLAKESIRIAKAVRTRDVLGQEKFLGQGGLSG
jgi:hypothetical protein